MIKKILLINKSLVIGGIETVLINQYNGFLNLGYDVNILLYKDIVKFDIDINNVVLFKDINSLSSFFKTNKYDLIISHVQSERICRDIKRTNYNNIIFIIHGILSDKLKNGTFIARFLRTKRIKNLYKNQNIVSVSNAVKIDIEAIGIKAKNNKVIYNPIDIDFILKNADENIENIVKFPYLVFVANISDIKNLPLLIEIYHYISDHFNLVIIGDGNQSILDEIKKTITKYSLNEKVFFLGSVNNPYPYMKMANGLLVTSKNEGFGMVVVEALILETPVFSITIPAVVELLTRYFPEGILDNDTNKEMAKHIVLNQHKNINLELLKKELSNRYINKKYLSYANDIF